MLSRFVGDDNKRNVIEAIKRQQAVAHDEKVAKELAAVAQIALFQPGTADNVLIKQDGTDQDIFFILAGRVSVVVHGREVAVRVTGQHVGEMAMIEPSAPRCATVYALQPTVVAKVSERDFTRIADKKPWLWRQIALELGNRLRERNKLVRPTNPRPVVFVGSAKEGLAAARAIQALFGYDDLICRPWTDGFRPSATTIENLERELQGADFAILVVTADDLTLSRDELTDSPRDNVIWEHGFFTGGLGRGRVFVVKPRGVDLKVPSDWGGITLLDYDPKGTPDDLRSRLGAAVDEIRTEILRLKVK